MVRSVFDRCFPERRVAPGSAVLPSTASGVFQGAPECWVEGYVAPALQLLPELPATQEQVHFADVHKCEGMRSATLIAFPKRGIEICNGMQLTYICPRRDG